MLLDNRIVDRNNSVKSVNSVSENKMHKMASCTERREQINIFPMEAYLIRAEEQPIHVSQLNCVIVI